jgi:hypothetical protein
MKNSNSDCGSVTLLEPACDIRRVASGTGLELVLKGFSSAGDWMLLVVDVVGHVQVAEPQPQLNSNASRSGAS